jgi:hypothetical protein
VLDSIYLFECKYFERERKQLLPNIQKSNVLIYHDLLNNLLRPWFFPLTIIFQTSLAFGLWRYSSTFPNPYFSKAGKQNEASQYMAQCQE